jgi:hypothetical protein
MDMEFGKRNVLSLCVQGMSSEHSSTDPKMWRLKYAAQLQI